MDFNQRYCKKFTVSLKTFLDTFLPVKNHLKIFDFTVSIAIEEKIETYQ